MFITSPTTQKQLLFYRSLIAYQQLINCSSENSSKAIWKATYDEFLLKSQAYSLEGKYSTFEQMITNYGRASLLYYKCGFAAAGFMDACKIKYPV